MSDELIIIEKCLDNMAEIFNVMPGDKLILKDADTLAIMQRRMPATDLLDALKSFNEIVSKDELNNSDISIAAISYVKIKVLIESKAVNFDDVSLRLLCKEYRAFVTKTQNIISITRVSAMTATLAQKDHITKTQAKNAILIDAFIKEADKLEATFGDAPKELVVEPKEEIQPAAQKESVLKKAAVKLTEKIDKKSVEQLVVSEQLKRGRTKCKEIFYFEKSLGFKEVYICKDIPAYSLMIKNGRVFFGLTKNVNRLSCSNDDESIYELTAATEDFVQYMTTDLLSGEYELTPFTKDEKKSLEMYFNFVSNCFEQNIGITLTVQEYLGFKDYYNRLVLKMFELEEDFRKQYYKALVLADNYITYMNCYDLAFADEQKKIIKNIMNERCKNYVDDLELIVANHIVDAEAKDKVRSLIHKIKHFKDEEAEVKVSAAQPDSMPQIQPAQVPVTITSFSGKLDPTLESIDPALHFDSKDYNDGAGITADDLCNVQIKIQFLNTQHVIVDEALFAVSNVKQAVIDYLMRHAYVKKIGLYMNEKEVFLFTSKNGSLTIPVLDEKMRRIKHLDEGIQGEIVEFYEEKMKKLMVELAG